MTAIKPPTRGASRKHRIFAAVFALVGLSALGVSIYSGRKRYLREHPPPLPGVIAPIPPAQQQMVQRGLNFVWTKVLHVTSDQQKQLEKLWNPLPRSVDEVVRIEEQTTKILTPEQLAKWKPVRTLGRHHVVDSMVEPLRPTMSASDFEKLRREVIARVDKRMGDQ